jgi:nicotinic acetylcholine receptor, invertebrate
MSTSADGDYQITTKTKATVHYDGKIVWEPPMIYKSYCAINIEYYPFDIQDCYMKFGSWTFDGKLINLEHININDSIPEKNLNLEKKGVSTKLYIVENGIDMSEYYPSVEWDVLSIPAQKNIKRYDCCQEPYYDIYFNITIRRKALFYTVNLIIPCVNISFLSVLVFYLPSSSGEKIALGIYVLVALLVFYLLLIELIPPTSLVIPLLGKYLLFTLILVNLSILLTIFILNLHHRKPNTHKMPVWMRRVLIDILPKFLMIERPKEAQKQSNAYNGSGSKESSEFKVRLCQSGASFQLKPFGKEQQEKKINLNSSSINRKSNRLPTSILNALSGVHYIHSRIKKDQYEREVTT